MPQPPGKENPPVGRRLGHQCVVMGMIMLEKLNAIGKPYSASYDPNYRLKHVVSTAHLRWPYLRMKFVGEELREASHHRQQFKRRESTTQKESTATTSYWKENTRKTEFTARAPLSIGGSYILSPFLNCWNIDYREKRGRSRRQLGFAHTLDEAKAIAQADSKSKEAAAAAFVGVEK